MVADGVNEGSKALRLPYPAILAHIGNHSNEGFLLQVLHLVGTQSPRPQLDPQKLFKIGDKVLLGRGVPRPQPFHICSVKSVELHASLCFLGQEYSLARPPGAMELPFHFDCPETERTLAALLVCRDPQHSSGVLIRGEPSPVPMCPSGRILARPERARMRLPSPKGGPIHWRNLGKSSASYRHDKKCRLSIPPNRRAETAAA